MAEQTMTTITTKIHPTVLVHDDALIQRLHRVNMSVFAEVYCETEPKMNKRENPFFGQVKKLARMNVNFGGIYKNAVQKKMEKEGIEEDFEPAPLQWGTRWNGSKVIIEHKGQFYAQMRPLRADDVSYVWKTSGEALTEEEIEQMKTFFPKKKEGSRQPNQDKVIIRTIKIENIAEVRMNGVRYVRVNRK